MRVFVFAQAYPVPYKPYYDTQFEDLLRQGHDLHIFATSRDPGTVNEKVRRAGLESRVRYFPATARQALPLLPRVASASLANPGLLWRAMRAAADAGVRGYRRQVVAIAGAMTLGPLAPDFILVHGLGTMSMLPWLRARYPGVPLAMYYHGGEVPGVAELDLAVTEAAFGRADVVFTNTGFSRDHAVSRGCPGAKVRILPVGFDLDDYRPAAPRPYRRDGTLRVLAAGRMSEEKGHRYALDAVRLLVERGVRNIHYSMTGQGYLRPSLEEYVRRYELEPYVTFLGALTTDNVTRAMGDTDVLLLSSVQVGNWVENQACAVQEAMLMGAIVVTTRTGGVPESIAPEMAPYVVPPNDGPAIAEALTRVMALSDEQLRALGEANRAFVQGRYDVRRLDEKLIATTLSVREPRAAAPA